MASKKSEKSSAKSRTYPLPFSKPEGWTGESSSSEPPPTTQEIDYERVIGMMMETVGKIQERKSLENQADRFLKEKMERLHRANAIMAVLLDVVADPQDVDGNAALAVDYVRTIEDLMSESQQ